MHMVKVISLSNKAYDTLRNIKGENESFSDLVIKLSLKDKKDIQRFFGVWKTKEGISKMATEIRENRRNIKFREVKL